MAASPLVVLLIEESVRRGTHVLVELPEGMTPEEAQELMKQLFREEALEIAAWLMTRKTNTLWTNDSIEREQNEFSRYAERENRRTEFND